MQRISPDDPTPVYNQAWMYDQPDPTPPSFDTTIEWLAFTTKTRFDQWAREAHDRFTWSNGLRVIKVPRGTVGYSRGRVYPQGSRLLTRELTVRVVV